jgi:6,7-dimethyl-8-ribityllumazine synthase
MASVEKNLGEYSAKNVKDISSKKIAIVVAEWNEQITNALYQGAESALLKHGALPNNIIRRDVPGSFELTLGAHWMAADASIDAVICLGCIIKGETKHDEYIANAVANGLTTVGLNSNKPVIFGVLTPNTLQQAIERSGGLHGNKGEEAAITAIKMLNF